MALVALGVTGGIGAYKAVEIARLLDKRGHRVRAVLTRAAARDAIDWPGGRPMLPSDSKSTAIPLPDARWSVRLTEAIARKNRDSSA
jgi:hypothetical protein